PHPGRAARQAGAASPRALHRQGEARDRAAGEHREAAPAAPRHRAGRDRPAREGWSEPMSERGQRRTLDGTVVSDKMDKTVVVRVERLVRDPRYEKYVRRYSRFMAHDPENACKVGDRVRIIEHRPLSKRKRWKVQATLSKATGV